MKKILTAILTLVSLFLLVGCNSFKLKDDNNTIEPSKEIYWNIKDDTLYISAKKTENACNVNTSILANQMSDYNVPWWNESSNSIEKVIIEKTDTYIAPTIMYGWFSYLTNCKSIEGLENIDTSLVVDMSGLFINCGVLKELDLSSFNTSNVVLMNDMFSGLNMCSLDLSSFDTSKVSEMKGMFSHTSMDSLDLSSFDTSNVENMSEMFHWANIKYLDISSFDTSNLKYADIMFGNPTEYMKNVDISHFDLSNAVDINDISDLYADTH